MTRAVAAFFILLLSFGAASAQNCGAYPNTLANGTNADANQVMANFNFIRNCSSVQQIANNATTATVLNELAIFTGAPTTATVATTSSTTGVAGIVIGGAGTSGNAQIAYGGQASCIFDGATSAGDYVQASLSSGGKCHDAGSTYPTSNQVLGRVLSTNAAGGTYVMEVFGPEINASTGGGGGSAGVPRSYLAGLTLSTAGGSPNFAIAPGAAANSTNTVMMSLASAYAKTTGAWAVGSGSGALDSGSIANSTWYKVFEIQRPDTGVVDICITINALNSGCSIGGTIPAAYTLFRYVGSMKTDGSGNWVKFAQMGDTFLWDVPVSTAWTSATTAALIIIGVPTGIKVQPIMSFFYNGAGENIYLSSPDTSDQIPGNNVGLIRGSGNSQFPVSPGIWTNTSAQIRVRGDGGGGLDDVNVQGWIDRRGRDS